MAEATEIPQWQLTNVNLSFPFVNASQIERSENAFARFQKPFQITQKEKQAEPDRQTEKQTEKWTDRLAERQRIGPHPTQNCALVRHLCVHKDMHNLCVAPVALPLYLSHSDSFYKVKGGVEYYDYQITFWHAFLVFVRRASNATLVPNSLAIMCLLYAFLSCEYAALIATSWPRLLLPVCPHFDCHWPHLITWLS